MIVAALLASGAVRAEWFAAAYLGGAHTWDSYLTVAQSSGSTALRGVSWDSRSFEAPPYYGVQVGNFFAANDTFGIRIDYNHDKVYAASSLAPALQRFSLSHGVNSITIDALWRHRSGAFSTYAGAGAGTAVPHVEAVSAAGSVDEYQWFRGLALKAIIGVTYDLLGPLAAFAEARITYIDLKVDIADGSASTALWTAHAAVGALIRL